MSVCAVNEEKPLNSVLPGTKEIFIIINEDDDVKHTCLL